MTKADTKFSGSIPSVYEHCLVPLIFEPYAEDLAGRVERLAPRNLLEIAAGTGVVTRRLAKLLPKARIVATDLNPAMLEVARTHSPNTPHLEWRQVDAESLPFGNESFDTVLCQFGVMFFSDKRRSYREAHRVLRGAGRFVFNVWDDLGSNLFAEAVTSALAETFPGDPPRFLSRTPHGYTNAEAIREDLLASGFTAVDIERVARISRCASPIEPALAYCQGTPLRNEILARRDDGLDEITRSVAEHLRRQFGPGPLEGMIRALVFSATR